MRFSTGCGRTGRRATTPRADLAQVKQSIGAPENLSAAIGYYRAMFDGSGHDPRYAEAQHASAVRTAAADAVSPWRRRRVHRYRSSR